jgi:signal peptidase II
VSARLAGAAARGWCRALAVAGVIVAFDQAAKSAVLQSLSPHETLDALPGVDIVVVANKGVAFGFLGGGGAAVVAVTAIALGLVLAWFASDPTRPGMWLAVGLLAGGALGNLADRARIGAVTDFIDPPLWPAFNIADVSITLGAVLLVLIALGPPEET